MAEEKKDSDETVKMDGDWNANGNHISQGISEDDVKGMVYSLVDKIKEKLNGMKLGDKLKPGIRDLITIECARTITVLKGIHQPIPIYNLSRTFAHMTIRSNYFGTENTFHVHYTLKGGMNAKSHGYKPDELVAVSNDEKEYSLFVQGISDAWCNVFIDPIARASSYDMIQPSLDESLDALRKLNVRVDAVIQHVLPGKVNSSNYKGTMDNGDIDGNSDDIPCGHRVQEKNQNASAQYLGVVSAEPEVILWKTDCVLRYCIADTVPEEFRYPIQAALVVGMEVWGKILHFIKITQTFDPSDATHLIQVRDLSEEFGTNVAAYGEFPEAGKQRHLVISTIALVEPYLSCLLSRLLHEMGHNMGFYHEFAAGKSGTRIGKESDFSIMGYKKERIVTVEDMVSFYNIYKT